MSLTTRSSGSTLTRSSRIGLGVAVTWFSVLVLLPLSAVVIAATEDGPTVFLATLTDPATLSALRLTVLQALGVTAVNIVMGTTIAWVLVRDDFPGKAILEVLIDLPFAMPTIVAGLVLVSLYGPTSPIGVNVVNTQQGIFLALLFVTLPFVVRTVQPVLTELDPGAEEAASSLGATRFTSFRRVVLPRLVPAIAAGASLAFARAMSEFGSLVLISGNTPFRTEVASLRILKLVEGGNQAAAATLATVLLLVSAVAIVALTALTHRVSRRG